MTPRLLEKMTDARCEATISFGDDHGDNSATFHCQLPHGHKGDHQESGDMGYGQDFELPYTLRWPNDAKNIEAAWDLLGKWEQWCCGHDWYYYEEFPERHCYLCGSTQRLPS